MSETAPQSSKNSINMKHSLAFFLIGIAGALAVGSLAVYLKQNMPARQMAQNQESAQVMGTDVETMKAVDDTSMLDPDGRYLVFDQSDLETRTESRRVLFFYANWCPTCAEAHESLIMNASEIPEDVIILRVNYNDPDTDQTEKDLAQKYGITYQHTFVQIDEAGNELTTWNGGGFDELLTNLEE